MKVGTQPPSQDQMVWSITQRLVMPFGITAERERELVSCNSGEEICLDGDP